MEFLQSRKPKAKARPKRVMMQSEGTKEAEASSGKSASSPLASTQQTKTPGIRKGKVSSRKKGILSPSSECSPHPGFRPKWSIRQIYEDLWGRRGWGEGKAKENKSSEPRTESIRQDRCGNPPTSNVPAHKWRGSHLKSEQDEILRDYFGQTLLWPPKPCRMVSRQVPSLTSVVFLWVQRRKEMQEEL